MIAIAVPQKSGSSFVTASFVPRNPSQSAQWVSQLSSQLLRLPASLTKPSLSRVRTQALVMKLRVNASS